MCGLGRVIIMKTKSIRPEVEVFNDSLARCLKSEQFFQSFLQKFLASSKEVRDKFEGTDLNRQRRVLRDSFYMLIEHVAFSSRESEAYFERIATEHSKQGRDITPHLYDLWLECLLRSVEECDDRYSPQVEVAWRYIMGEGIAYLKARYDRSGTPGPS